MVLTRPVFFLPCPTSPARLLHLTARRESHTLKSSPNLLLLPWHVPAVAAGSREEEEEGKEVSGIEESKGWQEGAPSKPACHWAAARAPQRWITGEYRERNYKER